MSQGPGATKRADVAFFMENLAGGGAERALMWLAGAIADRGYDVHFVLNDADCDYAAEISAQVTVLTLRGRSHLQTAMRLAAYLRRHRPAAIMSALDTPNIILLAAAKLARYAGRTVIGQRAVVDAGYAEMTPLRRALTKMLQHACFPFADVLISNSNAASRDVRARFAIPTDRIVTIHNALDVERVADLARAPLDDPFVRQNRAPLIVSVGSLTKRKDMATLVAAFDIVRSQRPAALVLVGKGPEQRDLEQQIAARGLGEQVHLPGFDANPFRWMAAADVFVSASVAEGFPNVIAEALALGRRVVATDCPGDTSDILGRGRWGRLVPVGDAQQMAAAIIAALDDAQPTDGRMRAADFSPSRIASAYLRVLLPDAAPLASRDRERLDES